MRPRRVPRRETATVPKARVTSQCIVDILRLAREKSDCGMIREVRESTVERRGRAGGGLVVEALMGVGSYRAKF